MEREGEVRGGNSKCENSRTEILQLEGVGLHDPKEMRCLRNSNALDSSPSDLATHRDRGVCRLRSKEKEGKPKGKICKKCEKVLRRTEGFLKSAGAT